MAGYLDKLSLSWESLATKVFLSDLNKPSIQLINESARSKLGDISQGDSGAMAGTTVTKSMPSVGFIELGYHFSSTCNTTSWRLAKPRHDGLLYGRNLHCHWWRALLVCPTKANPSSTTSRREYVATMRPRDLWSVKPTTKASIGRLLSPTPSRLYRTTKVVSTMLGTSRHKNSKPSPLHGISSCGGWTFWDHSRRRLGDSHAS
jgi:hypothetical protein